MKKIYLPVRNSFLAKKSGLLAVVLALIFIAGLLPAKLFAQAPTISYSSPPVYATNVAIAPLSPTSAGVAAPTGAYSQTAQLSFGLNEFQHALALDAAGNMYVGDNNGSNIIWKISAGGSSKTIIASGFNQPPTGVAVDKAGNVYVADQQDIWKVPASGTPVSYGTPVMIDFGSFGKPTGVAVDAAGNIYVTDFLFGKVYKMANDGSNLVEIDTALPAPFALAVDAAANVYVVDDFENALYEIPSNGSPQVQLASGFKEPMAVALDSAGNCYVEDIDESAGFTYIVPPGGGTPTALTLTGLVFNTNVSEGGAYMNPISGAAMDVPINIAIDGAYNLYVTSPNQDRVTKMSPTGGYFISPQLPPGLSFDNTTGTISGTPAITSPAKNYLVSAYNSSGGVSATLNIAVNALTISYSSPQAYLVNTAITPLAPVSSNVAAPTGVYGSPVLLGSGLTFSQNGLAVDAAGNMYINDQDSGIGDVKKISADGSSTTTIGSGFIGQSGNVAVDQAGNVFVADQASVWKIPASGSPVTYGAPVVINNTFTDPFAIAVDASGNVYVTDLHAGGVYKMANDGTNKVRIDNGITMGSGIAVDAAGNVYVSTISDFALYEIPANGSPQVKLATGFGFPRGLAVDGAGVIYIDDESVSAILTVPAGGGTPVTFEPGLTNLVGIAVDAGYNVYGALQGNGGVSKFSPTGGYFISPATLPAGLAFDNTTGIISGTPTALSKAKNYVVSAYNSSDGASTTVNIAVDAVIFSYASPQTYTAGAAITALAPTITSGTVAAPGYSTSPVPVAAGFLAPLGIAVDIAGNVYVADKGNGLVKEIPLGCGTPVSIGTGFTTPSGVAVDQKGNVYVADQAITSITEIPAGGGAQVSLGSGFTIPVGVAIDSTGNIYVADGGANTIYKIAANSGSQTTLVSGFLNLTSIAVDASGNIYATDGSGSAVYRIRAGSATLENIGGTFVFPDAVAVDVSGGIYVADGNGSAVYKISGRRSTQVSIGGSAWGFPSGIAVNGAGVVYVADAGPNILEKIAPTGGYYINRPLPTGLRLSNTTGTISGAPKRGSVATNYSITAYNGNGGTSALVNITVTAPPVPIISYSTPQTYTAGTAITPLTPASSGGTVAAPGYSVIPDTLGSGFSQPGGVAVDGKGNVYVADALNNLVKEIPAGNGTPVNIGGGFTFNNPVGIAIDSLGNVYVADEGNNTVEMITAASNLTVTTPIGTGILEPNAVAVDAAGDVYVTDENTQTEYEIVANGGSTNAIASNFAQLTGIAVDAAGNVYVADGGGQSVYKNPTGTSGGTTVGPAFLYPTGVAVDPSGNIYVADQGTNSLYKISAGSHSRLTTIGTGFNNPGGIAVDGSGNLYIADTDNNAIEEITPVGGYYVNRALPAGLSLDNTTGNVSGTPTAASVATNYTITAYNAGGSGPANLNITVNLPPPPTLSYTGPQVYTAGTAITPLAPTSSGVAAPAYNPNFTIKGTGFTEPQGVAVDTLGNVYVADPASAVITELPVGGGTPILIGSGVFSAPLGVALDAAGNIYVADFGNGLSPGAVYKVPVTGGVAGTPVTLGNPGDFGAPGSIAVDAAGNVYVGDLEFESVDEIPAGGGNTIFFNFRFGYTGGIAVDAAGNIYVSDSGSGGPVAVYEIAAGGGSRVKIGHGFNLPTGIAVDASGNIFVSDGGVGAVKEIPSGGGPQVTVGGFGVPFGIAADGKGNVYFSDDGDGTVKEINPVGGYYIRPALPAGLSFNSTTGAISGTPTAASPTTNYTINAYSYGGDAPAGVNITVNLPPVPVISYNSPNIYSINAAIAPLAPASTGGTVAAPGYSSSSVTKGPAFVSPVGVAADAAGNLYVADFTAGATLHGPTETTITKIPADGSPSSAIGSGFNNPEGVAVDAAGNVYVGDSFNNSVEKIPFSGGVYGSPIVVASGLNFPVGVAADAAGNVYVADFNNNAIKKIAFNGSTYGSPVVIGSGFNGPYGVAVDAAGNVYVADTFNRAVKMVPFSGGTYGSPVIIGSGFQGPVNVTVDAGGNVFVADAIRGVFEIVAPVSGGSTPVAIGGGFSEPSGVAADAAGNVYVADGGSTLIKQIKPVGGYYMGPFLPAGLSFDGTTGIISGTPTALSPATNYSVTAYNYGGGGEATVNIEVASNNANLTNLKISNVTIAPVFNTNTKSYTASVSNAIASVTVTPTTSDANATVTVNGATVASGSPSASLPLSFGPNTITTVVTAQDQATTNTYTTTITRVPSTNALIASVSLSPAATLVGTTGPGYLNFTAAVTNSTSNIQVIPTAKDATATITVNGSTVASGALSQSIPLNVGPNTITTIIKAQDGSTTKTVIITVTRAAPSTNALLASISLSPSTTLVGTTGTGYLNFSATVANSTSSVQVIPTAKDATATITVNGAAVLSGALSAPIALNVGPNVITTVITAQDGATTKTIIITVNRAQSSNAGLANLSISSGTLSPAFATATANYIASVPNTATTVAITPVTSDATATVKVNGATVASGIASASIPLAVGPNTLTTVVTAQNSTTTQSYTVIITRAAPSTNALLASISLSPSATLVGTTGTGYLNFSAAVANSTSSVQVIPTAKDATATITVNGAAVLSGALSAPIALNVGPNVITTVITAQDGATTKTIIITVNRAQSSNAGLANLSISTGTLAPAFATATIGYTASVPNTVTSLTVTPTISDATATVTVNSATVTSGTASADIALALGPNIIKTIVTAQNGATKTYTITITRVPSSNALLASIKTNPVENLIGATGPGYLNFTAGAANATSSIQVIPTAKDATATITVNGEAVTSGAASQSIALNVGPNTITTVIKAQDGITTKTIIITVTRAPSANANLANLSISTGTLTPAFATATIGYTASVPNTVASVKVTPTISDATATVTVNSATVTSGTASADIALALGPNTIKTIVTAQNGATKTYTVTITRVPSSNALLASIKTNPVETLVGATGPGYLNFTAGAANSTTSIQVIPTAKDATATITVNGSAVTSGTPSQSIALNVGANTLTTVITAQDGTTTKTIIITVNRAAPPTLISLYQPISVTKPADNITIENDGILVHQGISPNGDGVNDYLTIDNITNYPDNRLMIVDRNGVLVYETKGYDNSSRIFDGHSNKNGAMQLPGTYFYSLDYTVNGENKHKTGFIILKY